MSYRRTLRWVGVLLLVFPAIPGRGDEPAPSLRETFVETARLDGDTYRVKRDFLVGRGEALAPLLAEMARSEDWRERRLATVLRRRIGEPERCATARRWIQDGEGPVPVGAAPLIVDRLW